MELLKRLTEESAAHNLRQSKTTISPNSPSVFLEQAKSTLRPSSRSTSPIPGGSHVASPQRSRSLKSPQVGTERRKSSLENRRSTEMSRGSECIDTKGNQSNHRPLSGDSFTESARSLSFGESEISITSEEESGSQILSGSRIFQGPTLTKPRCELDGKKHRKEELPGQIHTNKPKSVDKVSPSNITDKRPETPSNIARAGQRAAEWAGWMRNYSKEVASRPRDYIERVSDMWSGGKKHYGQTLGAMPDEQVEDGEDDDGTIGAEERYREKFALPSSERLLAAYYGYLNRVIPLYGKIYLGDRHLCYRSLVPGTTRTKVQLFL